jgi:predicted metal-dependent hydrolase
MKDLEYKIVRSHKRRTLTITVERDRSLVVRARHPQKYKDRMPPGKEIVNGESAPYLGRDYRIHVGETESGQVELSRLFTVPPAQQAKRREVLKDWYIAEAKEKILARVEQHAHELGVEFSSARIVDNRYRWGSCTVGDSVNFNWRLIKAPMFVIDYVIVHELAHLIQGNHTPAFWNIVRANTPTMEKAKDWLKEHGQMLEEEI